MTHCSSEYSWLTGFRSLARKFLPGIKSRLVLLFLLIFFNFSFAQHGNFIAKTTELIEKDRQTVPPQNQLPN
jgi:hypothetical protein